MRQFRRLLTRLGGMRVIMTLGVIYLGLAVGWALFGAAPDASLWSILIVSGFIGGSGTILLLGGYRLPETDIHPKYLITIAVWCLGAIGVMLAILTLYHLQPDTGLSEPGRSVPILTGFSSVAGFAVGQYNARAKTQALELKRQNQLLERTQQQLEESNERLEQFAYAASHDLQEPLRMVSNYLQLIENRYAEDFDEDGKEFLEYAIGGSERMKAMIDGLLEYSRVETQGDPFEPVDLNEVLADVRQDLKLSIEQSDTTIEVDELPRIDGDKRQLRQLFQNLLSNAIEYSGDEPPRIEVTAERDDDDWIVEVHDNGIGINPEDQDRIFEVFQRLHTQDEQVGTGLGLALCKRIVERHGGEIRVDSEPGEASTFSIRFQAVQQRLRERNIVRVVR
jgi:two-component system, chemotaxis family, sensor kinase Cph1